MYDNKGPKRNLKGNLKIVSMGEKSLLMTKCKI